jgi:hypothetical protein
LAATNDHAFIVRWKSDDDPGDLLAVDWSDPDAPAVVGSLALPMNPNFDVTVAGDWLIANRYTAEFIDITDPSNLRPVGWAGPKDGTGLLNGPRLDVFDAAVGAVGAFGRDVWLADVGDLGAGITAQLRLGSAWPPAIVGELSDINGVQIGAGDGFAAVLDAQGITRLTAVRAGIAGTTPPARGGSAERLGETGAVLLGETRAYARGDSNDDLAILDIGAPERPRVIGRVPAKDPLYADDRRVISRVLGKTVEHWDVADPAAPRLTARYELPHFGAYNGGVRRGDTVYAAGHAWCDPNPCGAIFMIPLDGGAPPVSWPWTDPPSTDAPTMVALLGRDGLIAADEGGYAVLDLAGTAPEVVARRAFTSIGGFLLALEVVDDYLVAADRNWVEVHRLTGADSPQAQSFEIPRRTYQVGLSGRLLFAAGGVWRFRDDFTGLDYVGELGWPTDFVATGSGVLAASGAEGLRLFRLP